MFALIISWSGSLRAMILRWALQGHYDLLVLLLCFIEIPIINTNSVDSDQMTPSAVSELVLDFANICVSLGVNFNESLTNNIVSFEQLGPDHLAGLS